MLQFDAEHDWFVGEDNSILGSTTGQREKPSL